MRRRNPRLKTLNHNPFNEPFNKAYSKEYREGYDQIDWNLHLGSLFHDPCVLCGSTMILLDTEEWSCSNPGCFNHVEEEDGWNDNAETGLKS